MKEVVNRLISVNKTLEISCDLCSIHIRRSTSGLILFSPHRCLVEDGFIPALLNLTEHNSSGSPKAAKVATTPLILSGGGREN